MTNEAGLEFEQCEKCGSLLHSDKFLQLLAKDADLNCDKEDNITINRDVATQIIDILHHVIFQESAVNAPYMSELQKDASRLKIALEGRLASAPKTFESDETALLDMQQEDNMKNLGVALKLDGLELAKDADIKHEINCQPDNKDIIKFLNKYKEDKMTTSEAIELLENRLAVIKQIQSEGSFKGASSKEQFDALTVAIECMKRELEKGGK